MRKLSLLLAIIVLLAGVSVQAQKKSPRFRIGPVDENPKVVIQDDNGGGFFVFDPVSGEFKCVLCEYAYTLSGVGNVKIDGCNIYFSYIEQDYRIFATANMCDQQADLACEVYALKGSGLSIEPILEYWKDSLMKDNTEQCDGKIE